MSDPEEYEDDMSDDKDSTHSGVVEGNVMANVVADGDGDCGTCEDEEKDLSDDFFDASGGVKGVIAPDPRPAKPNDPDGDDF